MKNSILNLILMSNLSLLSLVNKRRQIVYLTFFQENAPATKTHEMLGQKAFERVSVHKTNGFSFPSRSLYSMREPSYGDQVTYYHPKI